MTSIIEYKDMANQLHCNMKEIKESIELPTVIIYDVSYDDIILDNLCQIEIIDGNFINLLDTIHLDQVPNNFMEIFLNGNPNVIFKDKAYAYLEFLRIKLNKKVEFLNTDAGEHFYFI